MEELCKKTFVIVLFFMKWSTDPSFLNSYLHLTFQLNQHLTEKCIVFEALKEKCLTAYQVLDSVQQLC